MSVAVDHLPYRDNHEHLKDELRCLDLRLRLRISASPRDQALPDLTSRAVHVSRAEVDGLLESSDETSYLDSSRTTAREDLARLRGELDSRIARSRKEGVFLALPLLCDLFRLSPFERDAITICLAPELRRTYDRLYAFVQDDITRKRPSVDLILDLLCDTEGHRWSARKLLADEATLLRTGLLEKVDDPHSPSGSSGLAQFLRVDPRICSFLLGCNQIDQRLAEEVQVFFATGRVDQTPIDASVLGALSRLVDHHLSDGHGPRKLALHLYGPQGVGKREMALHICRQLNCLLLNADAELLLARGPQGESLLRSMFREAMLQQAVVYLEHADALLQQAARPLLRTLQVAIAEYGWLTFLSGAGPWTQQPAFPGCAFHSTLLEIPAVAIRTAVWEQALENDTCEATSWAARLASLFRLTPGQIHTAVDAARNRCHMSAEPRSMGFEDVALACRQQSRNKLGELALKIEPRYTWNDLVLPEDKLAHLREISSHVRHQYRVFGKWGFSKRPGHGKGLCALFSGASGTGKTMAAEVLAHDLALDLYKVDLSCVVSKYIGETEKNLARVFAEAESSNAILFFDEADALFGKRTEISDAHDRYANIEASYLLQRMEQYEGVLIMATNLRDNMDEAFTRRIRFIVEFPFPDEAHCLRIWKGHFPASAPLSPEIDYAYLAQEHRLTGGNISNIALSAAFLAAENGGKVGMEHILHGARREYEKMGRIWREPSLTTAGGTLAGRQKSEAFRESRRSDIAAEKKRVNHV